MMRKIKKFFVTAALIFSVTVPFTFNSIIAEQELIHLCTENFDMAINSPTDIPGCVLCLDANAIVGLSDGDPVATWSDLSSAGNTVTQASSGARPTYQTNELNGKPIVRFDGNDFLERVTTSGISLSPLSIFVVVKTTGAFQNLGIGIGTGGGGLDWYRTNSGSVQVLDRKSQANIAFGSTNLGSNFRILGIIDTGSGTTLYIDGSVDGTGPTGAYSAGTYISIGAYGGSANHLTGDIAEIVVYDHALSAGQLTDLMAYFNCKWFNIGCPTAGGKPWLYYANRFVSQ